MAVVALQGSVRANQRKTVLVVLDVFNSHIPALDCMALLAAGPHLPAVHIGMAVGALVSNIAENWFGMALRTGDILVHAAQRIAGLIVVELGDRPDRLPTQRRMTVLTGDVQISVRAPRLSRHISAGARCNHSEQRQRQRHSGQKSCDQGLPQPRGLNANQLVSYEFRTSMTKRATGYR